MNTPPMWSPFTEAELACPCGCGQVTMDAGFMEKMGYQVQIFDIDCSEQTALERNEHREVNNVSAYFCESYHINWLLDALGVPLPPIDTVEEIGSDYCDIPNIMVFNFAGEGQMPDNLCQTSCDIPEAATVKIVGEDPVPDNLWQRLKAKIRGEWR